MRPLIVIIMIHRVDGEVKRSKLITLSETTEWMLFSAAQDIT